MIFTANVQMLGSCTFVTAFNLAAFVLGLGLNTRSYGHKASRASYTPISCIRPTIRVLIFPNCKQKHVLGSYILMVFALSSAMFFTMAPDFYGLWSMIWGAPFSFFYCLIAIALALLPHAVYSAYCSVYHPTTAERILMGLKRMKSDGQS